MPKVNRTRIFKTGSRTYFYSSLFFPRSVRDDVFTLYSFVRVLDDFVDLPPQQPKKFYQFLHDYKQELKGKNSGNQIVSDFVTLAQKHQFDPHWTQAFFDSMQSDLDSKSYLKQKDTLWYIHGSAEVIGLMMAKTLSLPPESFESAKLLGRTMQFVNFIRDIDEDVKNNRCYFSKETLNKYQLVDLKYQTIINNQEAFHHFLRDQITLYREWNNQAHEGFKHIPRRLRIPIATASNMYVWTSRILYEDPLMVYCKKIKPTKWQILKQIAIQTITF